MANRLKNAFICILPLSLVGFFLHGVSFSRPSETVVNGESLRLDSCHFRRCSLFDNGALYCFLRNNHTRAVMIDGVVVDGVLFPGIDLAYALPTLLGNKRLAKANGTGVKRRVLWVQVLPNPIPAGGVGNVKIKFISLPTKPIRVRLNYRSGRELTFGAEPVDNPLRISAVTFSESLDTVHVYLHNLTSKTVTLEEILVDQHAVTERAVCRGMNISPGGKSCFRVSYPRPIKQGQLISIKCKTEGGLVAQEIVRAFSLFPVTVEKGAPPPGLLFNAEPIVATLIDDSASSVAKGAFINEIASCPMHTHGSLWPGSRVLLGRYSDALGAHPEYPAMCHLCRFHKEVGMFLFGDSVDLVRMNFYVGSTWYPQFAPDNISCGRWLGTQLKLATQPRPFCAVVPTRKDKYRQIYAGDRPTPNELRRFVYEAVGVGAKGIFYRGLNANVEELWAIRIREEIKRVNEELHQLRSSLRIAEPTDWATVNTKGVSASALLAGLDEIILVLVRQDMKNPVRTKGNRDELSDGHGDRASGDRIIEDVRVTLRLPSNFIPDRIERAAGMAQSFETKKSDRQLRLRFRNFREPVVCLTIRAQIQ